MRKLWSRENKNNFTGIIANSTKSTILNAVERWVRINADMEDYHVHYAGHGTISKVLPEWSGMMCASDKYIGIEEILHKISYYASGYNNKFGKKSQPKVWVYLDNCGA